MVKSFKVILVSLVLSVTLLGCSETNTEVVYINSDEVSKEEPYLSSEDMYGIIIKYSTRQNTAGTQFYVQVLMLNNYYDIYVSGTMYEFIRNNYLLGDRIKVVNSMSGESALTGGVKYEIAPILSLVKDLRLQGKEVYKW